MGNYGLCKKTKWDIDYELINTPEKALKYYTEEIECNPLNENLYVERGKAYEALKQFDLAIQDFSTAFRLNPQEGWFHCFLRHKQYIQLGDLEKALEDMKQCIRLSPSRYMYEPHLASLYEKLGQRDNAIAVLNQGVEMFPVSVNAYLKRAEFYEQIGYLEEALSDITQAINMAPKKAMRFIYMHQRAKIYVRMRRFDEALRDCNECIAEDPKEWTHFRVRSEVYDAMGNHWASKADYEISINLNTCVNR
jgi:tetratricopeptide (TPR) repeat protein